MIYTDHALEQFTTRSDREMCREEARELLAKHPPVKAEKTRTGEQYWDVPELGVRLISKRGTLPEDNNQEVVLTIVKAREQRIPMSIMRDWDTFATPSTAQIPKRGWVTFEVKVLMEFKPMTDSDRETKFQKVTGILQSIFHAGMLYGIRVQDAEAKVVKDDTVEC